MGGEKIYLPCMAANSGERAPHCDCAWKILNGKNIYELGRDRSVAEAFHRNGFAAGQRRVLELLDNPRGVGLSLVTEAPAFFTPEMVSIRNWLVRQRARLLFGWEDDPNNIRCPHVRQMIAEHHYDSTAYLKSWRAKL